MNSFEILNVRPGASREQLREAYLALARRWHPDRFLEGPEREWACARMAQINAAYQECLKSPSLPRQDERESEQLKKIEDMLRQGELQDARAMLMRLSTRSAEWNYLFGAVLLRMREYKKALTFLSVAAHQCPQNEKYLLAERAARAAVSSPAARLRTLVRGLRG